MNKENYYILYLTRYLILLFRMVFHPVYVYYEQLFFIVMAFALMVGSSYWYVNRVISDQIDVNSQAMLKFAQYRSSSLLSEMEIPLYHLAHAVEHLVDLDLDQETIQRFVFEMTDGHIKEGKNFICRGVFGEVRGKRLDGSRWDPPSSYDYKNREWYLKAVESQGKIYYTEPYFSKFSGKLTVTLSKSLHRNKGTGEFCGVMSIDFDVEKIADFIEILHVSNRSYALLLDSRLNVIAHRDYTVLGKKIFEISEGGKQFGKDLQAKRELNQTRYVDVFGKINIGHFQPMDNGWYIASITPVETYYKGIRVIGSFLSGVGFVCITILSIILAHLHSEKMSADTRSRSKSSFLAKMSHEIRTPMNSIMGMSELILRDKKILPLKTVEYMLIIKQSSTNLLAIINDILDLSKIESGKMGILCTEYMFSSLINDVLNIIRAKVRENSLQFLVFVDGRMPEHLFGDVTHVRQILLNLLNNAVKYTREGSVSLEVTCVRKGKEKSAVELNFAVCDTGIGIKDEDKSKLFADFVQLDSVTNLHIEGTGLGLAITRELLHKMGGFITMESEYGVGSVFTASLPQIYQDDIPFAKVEKPENHKILVFEPRYAYEKTLTRTLDNLEVKYHTVPNCSAFHKILQSRHDYNFIFLASFLYEDVKQTLEVQEAGIQTVLFFEDMERTQIPHVWSMTLPIHSLLIANLLNNLHSERYEDSDIKTHFRAPTARVLIVDDNRANLMVAEGLMEPYEMQIDCVMSGKEAIECTAKNHYDLIFMDHMMPEMDGIEASSQIRQQNQMLSSRQVKEIPIIALTANAVVGMREIFLKNGIDDCLSKPIELNKLHSILVTWLPRNKLEIALDSSDRKFPKEEISIFISGINTAIGLIQTGGTLEKYLRVLTSLDTDIETKLHLMHTALDEKNVKSYRTYVHGFKSALATVGALPLSATAAALEIAASQNDWDYIVQHNDAFMYELESIHKSIKVFLESHLSLTGGKISEEEADFLKSELLRLKTAICDMKPRTIDEILDGLFAKNWSKEIHGKLEEISQNLLIFEWDNAVTLIDDIVEN